MLFSFFSPDLVSSFGGSFGFDLLSSFLSSPLRSLIFDCFFSGSFFTGSFDFAGFVGPTFEPPLLLVPVVGGLLEQGGQEGAADPGSRPRFVDVLPEHGPEGMLVGGDDEGDRVGEGAVEVEQHGLEARPVGLGSLVGCRWSRRDSVPTSCGGC